MRFYWNQDWEFVPEYLADSTNWENAQKVRLPHTVQEVPQHYFDEGLYQKNCAYRRNVFAPQDWAGKHLLMTVEAAGHSAWVYLNGQQIAEHHCGYTAFTVDLMPWLNLGEDNCLLIRVDSREQQNLPPFGNVIDYMTFGGLYREVYADLKEDAYIRDVFVQPHRETADIYKLVGEVTCENADDACVIRQSLRKLGGTQVKAFADGKTSHRISNVKEWTPETPELYILRTELYRGEQCLDTKEVRFGFREAEFRTDGFYLNGVKTKLRGLNRHQSYPYVGYAAPKSMQRNDAEILKNELGCNAVRTSHYPQSHHFIDRCDELGLLVFTEIPGWQHIGDAAWKDQAVQNTKDMVLQYRNHPSIILWGVRINESQDDDEFYERTNAAAHTLDPTRQTSGVRYIQKSSLLEDVYAFNDFSHEGDNPGCRPKKAITPNTAKGYLISEYNGHMYPTKSHDAEDHRTEHMLRHARVMNAYYGHSDISGGFGWCMFDYNTHKDFGSGDHICYHGVLDLFRNPKLAAAVYASQQDSTPVLEISSSMDIGEHPACLMKDVYAVTNADSVRLYKNDVMIREFGSSDTPFKDMPHGPILMDDFIGNRLIDEEHFSPEQSAVVKRILMDASRHGLNSLPASTKLLAAQCILRWGMKMQDAIALYNKYIGNWGGTVSVYRFDAVKNGEVVRSVTKSPVSAGQLRVLCSHTELTEETTYDMAAIRIQAVDKNRNILSFCHEPLLLEAEGCIELVGPKLVGLDGGMGGTYVRTTGTAGSGSLRISSENLGETTIQFTVR